MIIIVLLLIFIAVALLVFHHNFAVVRRMFTRGNVCVCGLRGRGKDMLMSNVACRSKLPYASNIDYGGNYTPLDLPSVCIPDTYDNLISGNIVPYTYPYPDGTDIYLSDAGVYLPCQYNDKLNRSYSGLSTFSALSRHVGNCNIHYNTQSLSRVWDKMREQCDQYIMTMSCKVFFGKIVLQRVRIYEKYQSAVDCVPPCRFRAPLFGATGRTMARIERQKYEIQYGKIKSRTLLYINKSHYDTRYFRTLLGGENNA